MKTLHIIPQDAWFFRDGRPYRKDETDQSDIESIFPPYPSSLSGAIRAALARNAPEFPWIAGKTWPGELDEVLGSGTDDLGKLHFIGPFLHHWKMGHLFPAPLHLIGKQGVESHSSFSHLSLLQPGDPIETDLGSSLLPTTDPNISEGSKLVEGHWISKAALLAVLNGRPPSSEDLCKKHALWAREPRIGLHRNPDSHTVEEAALYSPIYVRLNKGVSLSLGVSGLPANWSLPECFPLGGEGRQAVHLSTGELSTLEIPLPDEHLREKFIVINLTPLVLPENKESRDVWPKPGYRLPGIEADLVSACLGKPVFIGGWDSISNRPLPLRPCLPSGCVMFFDGKPPSDTIISLGDRTAHGFGCCVAGHWPNSAS